MRITEMMRYAAVAATLLFAGCGGIGCDADAVVSNGGNASVRSNGTYAVVIGMETSCFAGNCPGASYDAKRMRDLISRYAGHVQFLQSEDATHAAVVMAMEEACDRADLFVLYYSGHGGSRPFGDTGSEEEDGSDEFLCLYDTYMRDNEIWQIINRCKGRVFLMFDCCHSHTMFMQPAVTLACHRRLLCGRRDGSVRMMCWSGCPDDTYSYGSASGGEMTNALLRHFADGITYDDLWYGIDNDVRLKAFEDAQRTDIGEAFGNATFLR